MKQVALRLLHQSQREQVAELDQHKASGDSNWFIDFCNNRVRKHGHQLVTHPKFRLKNLYLVAAYLAIR
uniref:Transposase n=1 Tax=Romanomermis culicivorax TaxID=13658 RepID=A0A915KT30_ROMCU